MMPLSYHHIFLWSFLCSGARVTQGVNFRFRLLQAWMCLFTSFFKRQQTSFFFFLITLRTISPPVTIGDKLPLSLLELDVSWILYIKDSYMERFKDRVKPCRLKYVILFQWISLLDSIKPFSPISHNKCAYGESKLVFVLESFWKVEGKYSFLR